MKQKRAKLVGVLFGGLIGPALGGFFLGLHDYLKYTRLDPEYADPGILFIFPFMAIVLSGIPGALVGYFGGPWLVRVGRRAWVRGLVGATLGFVAVVLAVFIIAIRDRGAFFAAFGTFKETFPLGVLAGLVAAVLFPVCWVAREGEPILNLSSSSK